MYIVIEIAKGFIPLNIHRKLTSSWSQDFNKIYLFCTVWQCQQLLTIYQPITVSLETAPNPMSKTLLYYSRMKCPIKYKRIAVQNLRQFVKNIAIYCLQVGKVLPRQVLNG